MSILIVSLMLGPIFLGHTCLTSDLYLVNYHSLLPYIKWGCWPFEYEAVGGGGDN
jgi:hypothetical protein